MAASGPTTKTKTETKSKPKTKSEEYLFDIDLGLDDTQDGMSEKSPSTLIAQQTALLPMFQTLQSQSTPAVLSVQNQPQPVVVSVPVGAEDPSPSPLTLEAFLGIHDDPNAFHVGSPQPDPKSGQRKKKFGY